MTSRSACTLQGMSARKLQEVATAFKNGHPWALNLVATFHEAGECGYPLDPLVALQLYRRVVALREDDLAHGAYKRFNLLALGEARLNLARVLLGMDEGRHLALAHQLLTEAVANGCEDARPLLNKTCHARTRQAARALVLLATSTPQRGDSP